MLYCPARYHYFLIGVHQRVRLFFCPERCGGRLRRAQPGKRTEGRGPLLKGGVRRSGQAGPAPFLRAGLRRRSRSAARSKRQPASGAAAPGGASRAERPAARRPSLRVPRRRRRRAAPSSPAGHAKKEGPSLLPGRGLQPALSAPRGFSTLVCKTSSPPQNFRAFCTAALHRFPLFHRFFHRFFARPAAAFPRGGFPAAGFPATI